MASRSSKTTIKSMRKRGHKLPLQRKSRAEPDHQVVRAGDLAWSGRTLLKAQMVGKIVRVEEDF
jgi:hypothetical protein